MKRLVLWLPLTLSACNFPGDAFDPKLRTYVEFESTAKLVAHSYLDKREGVLPKNCGIVEANQNPIEVNTCIANAQLTPYSAYAIYKRANGSAHSISVARIEGRNMVEMQKYGSDQNTIEDTYRISLYGSCDSQVVYDDLSVAPYTCVNSRQRIPLTFNADLFITK